MDLLNGGLKTTLEVVIRAALRRDPATLRRLEKLDGKVVEIHLTAPALRLFLFPVVGGLELAGHHDGEADCSLHGGASDFLEVALDEQKTFGAGIRSDGDTQLAMELKRCLQQLDIDWESILGDRIGDLAAHQLAELFLASTYDGTFREPHFAQDDPA